jgi:hypothetical protein
MKGKESEIGPAGQLLRAAMRHSRMHQAPLLRVSQIRKLIGLDERRTKEEGGKGRGEEQRMTTPKQS